MVKRILLLEIYLPLKPSSFLVSEQLFDRSLFGLLNLGQKFLNSSQIMKMGYEFFLDNEDI